MFGWLRTGCEIGANLKSMPRMAAYRDTRPQGFGDIRKQGHTDTRTYRYQMPGRCIDTQIPHACTRSSPASRATRSLKDRTRRGPLWSLKFKTRDPNESDLRSFKCKTRDSQTYIGEAYCASVYVPIPRFELQLQQRYRSQSGPRMHACGGARLQGFQD